MIKLPINQQWRQSNEGDIFSSIWSSYGIDLTGKKGELRISPRMLLNVKSTDLTNMGVPSAFKFFQTPSVRLWSIAGTRVFTSAGVQNSSFSEADPFTSPPTNLNSDYSDIEIAFGYMYFSAASRNLYTVSSAGTWATLSNKLDNSSGLHDLEYFRAQNRLYFVDDNGKAIGSIDSSNNSAGLGAQYTLKLIQDANVSVISWIKSTSNRIWIGTINYSGTEGRVYAWDGSQTSGPNESYKLDSAGSLACVIKDDVPYIIDTKGRLLKFNGGTFSGEGGENYLDRFPIEEESFGSYFGNATSRPIHYNGMTLSDKGNIQILVNSAPWTTGYPLSKSKENFPSGVWEYTRETGLYHKKGVGYGTNSDSPTDYGQQKLSKVGAISYIKIPSNSLTPGNTNGTYIVGAEYYTDATTTVNAIFYDDSNDVWQKAGYFVTPKIYATNIEDTFNEIYGRFTKLNTSGDKIIFKYRTDEIESVEGVITWLGNDDVFNCSEELSDFSIGDEVEILQGLWAGKISTISQIDGSYTIKTSDSFSGASGTTGRARFQKWKTAGTVTSYTDKFKRIPINSLGTWIQIKVYIVKTGKFDFHDVLLTNKSNILIN